LFKQPAIKSLKKPIMKNIFTKNWAIVALFALTIGCTKDQVIPEEISVTNSGNTIMAVATTGSYTNFYEGKKANSDGTYTYTWSMQNNSGIQNLSHWTMDLGTCVKIEDVVSAAEGVSLDNMSPVELLFQPDPSFDNTNLSSTCIFTNPVFKFNLGTIGTAKSFYCITLNKNVSTADVTGYYKSGKTTGCGSFTFTGLGCEVITEQGYSYSQGYWFARPSTVWPGGSLFIGGKTYSQKEGKAIWDASNKKGLADSKAAFTQAAAILLSGDMVKPGASVWADVQIVQNYLSTLNKLTPTVLPTGNADAKAAAGRISDWITAHHVDTTFGN
jgi:hypothetical protein